MTGFSKRSHVAIIKKPIEDYDKLRGFDKLLLVYTVYSPFEARAFIFFPAGRRRDPGVYWRPAFIPNDHLTIMFLYLMTISCCSAQDMAAAEYEKVSVVRGHHIYMLVFSAIF